MISDKQIFLIQAVQCLLQPVIVGGTPQIFNYQTGKHHPPLQQGDDKNDLSVYLNGIQKQDCDNACQKGNHDQIQLFAYKFTSPHI